MEFSFNADNIKVTSGSREFVCLEFRAEPEEVLANFKPEEIVRHVDHGDLLDAIGEDVAREYFGIEDSEA